jgi:hypothetical protein
LPPGDTTGLERHTVLEVLAAKPTSRKVVEALLEFGQLLSEERLPDSTRLTGTVIGVASIGRTGPKAPCSAERRGDRRVREHVGLAGRVGHGSGCPAGLGPGRSRSAVPEPAVTLPTASQPTDEQVRLALTRAGKPRVTKGDFEQLRHTLGCAGYGWSRSDVDLAGSFRSSPVLRV